MIPEQAALSPYGRINSLRIVFVFICTAVIGTLVGFSDRPALYSLVLILFTLVAAPAWVDWSRGRLDYFEPIHMVGLIYFTYFGLGAIWTVQNPRQVAYDRYIEDYIAPSVLYCVLGYLALLIGYYGTNKLVHPRPRPAESPKGLPFMFLTGGVGLAAYLATGVLDVASMRKTTLPPLFGSLTEFAPLFLFAWALSWLLFFGKRDTPAQRRLLLYLWIPGVVAVGFANFSNKALAMTLIGIPVIARWYARRKIAWRSLLLLLVLLMFVVFPLYNAYRWSDPKRSRGERFSATIEMINKWDPRVYFEFSLEGFKRRMAMINSVAVVVRDTGRYVPYANGETIFVPTVTFLLPRMLWRDKPKINLGREFGQTFRVTNSLTADTYIAATFPGELYWNFGLPGIVIGLAVFGGAMRFFYRRYGATPGWDPVQRATYILLLVRFARVESGIAMETVAVLRCLVMVEAIRWLGRRTELLETPPATETTAP